MSCWPWQSIARSSVFGRLRRQALGVCPSKTSSSWLGDPTLGDTNNSEDHRSCQYPRDSAAQVVSVDHLLLCILKMASTLSSLNEYLTWDRSMKPPPVRREVEACCVSAAKVFFLAGGS